MDALSPSCLPLACLLYSQAARQYANDSNDHECVYERAFGRVRACTHTYEHVCAYFSVCECCGFWCLRRYSDFYMRNSNGQVKSECDHIEEEVGVKQGLGFVAALIDEVLMNLSCRLDVGLLSCSSICLPACLAVSVRLLISQSVSLPTCLVVIKSGCLHMLLFPTQFCIPIDLRV